MSVASTTTTALQSQDNAGDSSVRKNATTTQAAEQGKTTQEFDIVTV